MSYEWHVTVFTQALVAFCIVCLHFDQVARQVIAPEVTNQVMQKEHLPLYSSAHLSSFSNHFGSELLQLS